MKIFSHAVFFVSFIAIWNSSAFADDFQCPAPSQQTADDIKGELDGSAQTFLKLGGANLKGKVEKTVVNLFSKYPSSDRLALITTMISTTCNMIRTSKTLSDDQKLDKWFLLLPVLRTFLPDDKKSEIPIPVASGPNGCPSFTSRTRVNSEYHSSPTVTVEVMFLDAYYGCQITNVDHKVLNYSQFSDLKIDVDKDKKRARVSFNLSDRPQQGFAELEFTVFQKAIASQQIGKARGVH